MVASTSSGADELSCPRSVVHELEVPLALAGLQVDGDEALARRGCCPDDGRRRSQRSAFRPADSEAGVFVDADLRPHAGVAVQRPRIVLPGVVAEFAGPRDRVEASRAACRCGRRTRGPGPWCCCASSTVMPFSERRADDDQCRRRRSAWSGGRSRRSPRSIWLVGCRRPRLPSDRRRRRCRTPRSAAPVLRVQRDQPVAGRDVQDAVVALAVGPVGDAAPDSWRGAIAARLPFAVLCTTSARRSWRRARRPSGACRRSCRARP